MADPLYQPKVYRKQGGDELVVASGGTLTIESGATVTSAVGITGTAASTSTVTNASAASGTVRTITGAMITGVALTSGNLVGTRGSVTITNATNVGSGVFLYGAQGKVIGGTGTIDTGSGMVYGVLGQLDLSGTTVTSGYVAGVGSDIYGVGSGLVAADLFYGQHAGGGTINSYLRAYGKATYAFEFDLNSGTAITTVAAGSAASKWVRMRVDGTAYKIALLADS